MRTAASLVSAGTEKMTLDLARRSLLGKAQDRPDLVQKVVQKIQRDGLLSTAQAVWAQLDAPIPLGYSCAGRVVALGPGAAGFRPGDRVACGGAKSANHAEMNSVPTRLCALVPPGLSDEEAAFVTVGAIALQGVRTAAPTIGETVAVLGLGLIGQLACQILRAAGCKVLGVDLEPDKVALALRCGADRAVLRSGEVDDAVAALTAGRGVDAVVICAATDQNDPIELAGQIARDRGRVVVIGAVKMDVPRRPYYDKELSLLQSRSYGPGRYDPAYEEQGRDYPVGYVRWTEERNFEAFLALCADKRVDVRPLITHRFPIDEATEAYRLLSGERREPYLGILLTYPTDRPLQPRVLLGAPPAAPVDGEVRLAVAGAGAFAASVLVPSLARAKGARLQAIASAKGISARQLGQKFGFRSAATDFASLCADPEVDAVVIATRHHLHAAQAIAALQAGKHVFVEKPLALTEEQLAPLLEEAQRSGRQLWVGFNRRFAPLAVRLHDFLAERSNPLLFSYRVNAGALPPNSWIQDPEVGGGRIVGEVCHFIDLFSYLCDSLPVGVHAVAAAGSDRSAGAPEDLIATLTFADGSIGTIVYGSRGDATFSKERLEVVGASRVAVLDDFKTLELVRRGKRQRVGGGKDKGHDAEVQAFVQAVARGGPAAISLDSLARTTRATFAIERALRTGEPQRLSDT